MKTFAAGMVGVIVGALFVVLFISVRPNPKIYALADQHLVIEGGLFLTKGACESVPVAPAKLQCIAIDQSQALVLAVAATSRIERATAIVRIDGRSLRT